MTTAMRERNRKRLKRVMMDTRTKMYTGRLVNGVASTAGAPTNKTWVRYPANSTEETLAWGNVLRPDVPVWVQKNKQGQNEIVGVEYVEGTVKWNNALETVGAHPVINEIQPTSVGEFGILPGRVSASPQGSTYIRVQAFEHSGGRYPTTDIDVGAEYPAGDDTYGRIGVYLDPDTNTVTAFAGEEVFDRAAFTDADKLSVPDGMYPLGAVIVYDGNDISSANTFEDWRLHHSVKGGAAGGGSPLTTKGDLYTFDTAGARLAVGTDGQVLYADSAQPTGVRWGSLASGLSPSLANVYDITVPVTTGFSWVNQGSATDNLAADNLYLETPGQASGLNLRLFVKTAPSTPYTVTVGFMIIVTGVVPSAEVPGAGICFRESGSGKIHEFHWERSSGGQTISSRKWTNATTFSASYASTGYAPEQGQLLWYRIKDDGVNRICEFSYDKKRWRTLHTVGRTDFLTADQVGFFMRADAGANQVVGMEIISYLET